MRIQVLSLLTAGILAWGAAAQEQLPDVAPPREKARELPPPREKLPPPKEAPLPVVPAGPGCEESHPSLNVLWMEQRVPVQVLVPREVVTEVLRPSFEITYRLEKRTITNIVMKPREVLREVPKTTMVPCTETDPHTGHCSTVLKPVVEMTVRKDVEFYAVPVEKVELVKRPYLREVEEKVVRKTVLLEYQTEMQRRGYAVPVPGPEVRPPQWLAAPGCAAPVLPAAEGPPVLPPPERTPELPPPERTPELPPPEPGAR